MKNLNGLLIFLVGLFLCLSCEQDQDSKYPRIMQGNVDFSIESFVVKGTQTAFHVSNAIKDPTGNLTFEWSAPGFSPATGTGESFITIAPNNTGTYPVFLTVRAAGYRDIIKQKDVKLSDCEGVTGILTIDGRTSAKMNEEMVFAAAGISVPTEGLEYKWTAPDGGFFDAAGNPVTEATGKEFKAHISKVKGSYTLRLEAFDPHGHYCIPQSAVVVVTNNCLPMTGILGFSVSPSSGIMVQKGSNLAFVVNGITNPSSGLTYDWNLSGFQNISYPDADTRSTANAKAPATAGMAIIAVTANAPGYCEVTKSGTVTVADCFPLTNAFSITASGTKDGINFRKGTIVNLQVPNISTPAGVTYVWDAQGLSPAAATTTIPSWSPQIPATSGAENYTVTVTANAPAALGYCPATTHTYLPVGTIAMNGTLDIAASGLGANNTARPGSTLTFQAAGITNPTTQELTYDWVITDGTNPVTYTSKSHSSIISYPASTVVGTNIVVTLTAKANGYANKEITKTYKVASVSIEGNIQINMSGEGCSIDGCIRPGYDVTFTAEGAEAASPCNYEWLIAGTGSPVNGVGKTVTHCFPGSQADSYTITAEVKIKATNYKDTTIKKNVTVRCTRMGGALILAATPGFTVAKNNTLTLTASGITSPSASDIHYSWKYTGLTAAWASSADSTSVRFDTPATTGPRQVSVKATAKGYCVLETSQTVSIKDCLPMEGALTVTASGIKDANGISFRKDSKITLTASGITKPTGLSYVWSAPAGYTPSSATTSSNNNTATWEPVATISGNSAVTVTPLINALSQDALLGYCIEPKDIQIPVDVISMPGSLTIQVEVTNSANSHTDGTIAPGSQVTLSANGLNVDNVTYNWNLTNPNNVVTPIAPNTHTGRNWTITLPDEERNYTLNLTAIAAGYINKEATPIVLRVADINMTFDSKSFRITCKDTIRPGEATTAIAEGIIQPQSSLTYTWYEDNNLRSLDITNAINISGLPLGEHSLKVMANAMGYKKTDFITKKLVVANANMPGSLGIQIHGLVDGKVSPNMPITFEATGIPTSVAGVTYEWSATRLTAETQSSTVTTWTITPDVYEGSYSVALKAKATGYNDATTTKNIVVACASMPGTIDFTMSPVGLNNVVSKNNNITFVANPSADLPTGVSYKWNLPGFTPASSTAPTVTATSPNNERTVEATLTAILNGYCSKVATHSLQVKNCVPVEGALTLTATGTKNATGDFLPGKPITLKAEGITKPGNISYKWVAPSFFTPTTATTSSGEVWTTTPLQTNNFAIKAQPSISSIDINTLAMGYCMDEVSINGTIANATMTGAITITPSGEGVNTNGLRPGSNVLFTAGGITAPADVTYEWTITNGGGSFTSSTTAHSVGFKVPVTGDVSIRAWAKAVGYTDVTKTETFQLANSPMDGSLSITASGSGMNATNNFRPGSLVTFTPNGLGDASGVTYTWTMTGGTATNTSTGPTWSITLPAAQTHYTITVDANKTGYTTKQATLLIAAQNGAFTFANGEAITVTGTPQATNSLGFKAPTVSVPDESAISYTWSLPGFTNPSPLNGMGIKQTSANAPTVPNNYVLSLTMSAVGYDTKVLTQNIDIACKPLDGVIAITDNPAVINNILMLNQGGFPSACTLTANYTPNVGGGDMPDIYEWRLGTAVLSSSPATGTQTGVVIHNTATDGVIQVIAKKQGCALNSTNIVQYRLIDCPYKANDLVLSANYECKQRSGNVGNWQAYIKDNDTGGNSTIYRIVQMGINESTSPWWFAANLAANRGSYSNCSPEWGCYYTESAATVSGLDPCPTGWKVPTNNDWNVMLGLFGDGTTAAVQLRSIETYPNKATGWTSGSAGAGTDIYGFFAIPAGYCDNSNNKEGLSTNAYFWNNNNGINAKQILNSATDVKNAIGNNYKYSVRCVKITTP